MIYIGTVLYGFCEGVFGRDSYEEKRVEGIGVDWIVARGSDGYVVTAIKPFLNLQTTAEWHNSILKASAAWQEGNDR